MMLWFRDLDEYFSHSVVFGAKRYPGRLKMQKAMYEVRLLFLYTIVGSTLPTSCRIRGSKYVYLS